MKQIKLHIQGVRAVADAERVEEALKKDAGVSNVKVSGATGKSIVVYDEDITSQAEVLQLIQKSGEFQAEVLGAEPPDAARSAEPLPSVSSANRSLVPLFQKYTAKQLFFGGILIPALAGVLVGGTVLFAKMFDRTPARCGKSVAGGPHLCGKPDAPVKLVEYSDFECPYCKRHYPILKQILAEYGDKVSLEYKHFPLSFHPVAQPAAEASECAAEQGKFWEFHDAIFDDTAALSTARLPELAKQIGLNMNKFNDCVQSGKYRSKVAAESAEGEGKGVQGTPATFVNGELVSGAVPYEQIKQAIDAALQKK